MFDCGTPRIFEDGSYKYVFRTGPHATLDNVSLALYLTERHPNVKSIAGINQNYAWGQDSWADFEAAMKALKPGIEVKTSQMPKLMAGQFGAEITTLLASGADVVHSSLWGGDLEGLVLQGGPRGLFQKHKVALSAGESAIPRLGTKIPDGTILGGRGPFGPFAPDTELSRWFKASYEERYLVPPSYPAFRMTQAILGVKSAYEKAQKAGAAAPNQDRCGRSGPRTRPSPQGAAAFGRLAEARGAGPRHDGGPPAPAPRRALRRRGTGAGAAPRRGHRQPEENRTHGRAVRIQPHARARSARPCNRHRPRLGDGARLIPSVAAQDGELERLRSPLA
jgi:hypothetical protein